MPKSYITFGQVHVHRVNGKTFDCDCVAVINCDDEKHGRKRAFEFFDGKFHHSYYEEEFTDKETEIMQYYPRGLIAVEN